MKQPSRSMNGCHQPRYYTPRGELYTIETPEGNMELRNYDNGNFGTVWFPDGGYHYCTYDKADRISIVINQTASGAQTFNYTHDNNGNIRTINGAEAYRYDAFNRLTGVKNHSNGQTIATYTYDFAGRRTSKTLGGSTTYYHWDKDNNLIAETDSSGNVKATYTYDDKGNPLAMKRNGATYYYRMNSHADVISLTNSQGQIVNTYTYDPWGKILTENETVENPFKYQGSVYDSETGLYYLMSRYYDPNTCRFLSREGIDLSKMANPLGLNQYIYCVDNPVFLSDSDGKDPDHAQQRANIRRKASARLKKLWKKYGVNALKRKEWKKAHEDFTTPVSKRIREANTPYMAPMIRNIKVNTNEVENKGHTVAWERIEQSLKPIVVKTLYVGGGVETVGGFLLLATGNPFGVAVGESLVVSGFQDIMEGNDIENDVVDEPWDSYKIGFPHGFRQ